MTRYTRLDGFEFVDCFVRSSSILGFTAQDWSQDDPLEQRELAMFMYYPDKPKARRWAYAGVGEGTGVHCCPTQTPAERWTLVFDDGAVFVIGGGSAGYEADIKRQPHSYFNRVRMLPSGHACAVGLDRKVYVRLDVNTWEALADGLEAPGETSELDARGFADVAGFPTGDLYACGARGDLWQRTDQTWHRREVPTEASLRRILCASDGLVYVLTDSGEVLYGQDESWSAMAQEETEERLENLVEYQGRVLVSTRSTLFEVSPNRFAPANLGEPTLSGRSRIAAGDGLLLLAGTQDAAFFDGSKWTVILEPLTR